MKRTLRHTLVLVMLVVAARLHAQPATTPTPTATPTTTATPGDPPMPDSLSGLEFYNKLSWGVGMNVGLLSGAGASGRLMLPHGIGTQLSFFVISIGGYTHFNIGAEAQYAFIKKRDARLYGLFGLGFYSSTKSPDTTKLGNVIANPFRVGLGVGYEWFTSEQFVIHVAGAFTYFPNTSEFLPIPEVGFHFYFR